MKLYFFLGRTLIPSCSASHCSSPNTDCEERGHLQSENSYYSASLILKGESGHERVRSVIRGIDQTMMFVI